MESFPALVLQLILAALVGYGAARYALIDSARQTAAASVPHEQASNGDAAAPPAPPLPTPPRASTAPVTAQTALQVELGRRPPLRSAAAGARSEPPGDHAHAGSTLASQPTAVRPRPGYRTGLFFRHGLLSVAGKTAARAGLVRHGRTVDLAAGTDVDALLHVAGPASAHPAHLFAVSPRQPPAERSIGCSSCPRNRR